MDEEEDNGVVGTLLRLAIKALCNMALNVGMRLPNLMLEVARAYEALRDAAAETAPAAAAEEAPGDDGVQIIGPYYGFDVPPATADKMVRASLIEACGDTHYHPNLPEQSHPAAHERMRLRILHFLEGLRN